MVVNAPKQVVAGELPELVEGGHEAELVRVALDWRAVLQALAREIQTELAPRCSRGRRRQAPSDVEPHGAREDYRARTKPPSSSPSRARASATAARAAPRERGTIGSEAPTALSRANRPARARRSRLRPGRWLLAGAANDERVVVREFTVPHGMLNEQREAEGEVVVQQLAATTHEDLLVSGAVSALVVERVAGAEHVQR